MSFETEYSTGRLARGNVTSTQNTIRTHRQQIEKLKADNKRLKDDLALETRQAKQANNMSASAQIAKLQDQTDAYQRRINRERSRLEKLNEAVARVQEHIQEQREHMGGVNAFKDRHRGFQKTIRQLENRLDKVCILCSSISCCILPCLVSSRLVTCPSNIHNSPDAYHALVLATSQLTYSTSLYFIHLIRLLQALTKYNEARAFNKGLRSEIDNLRRERNVFEEIKRKLQREVRLKEQSLMIVRQETELANRMKMQAQQAMIQMKEDADDEHARFELAWHDLKAKIEEDRVKKDVKLSGTGKLVLAGTQADTTQEQARALKERVRQGSENINKDARCIEEANATVQMYEESFAKIQKATGITDVEQLVRAFVTAEDDSFAMFNDVNELSTHVERLEESISQLNKEINKFEGRGANDSERKKILAELDVQLNNATQKAAEYETRYMDTTKTINKLKEGIQAIFHKIGCASLMAPEMLGSAGVTESNMMQYLGVIEMKTMQLLEMYYAQQSKGQGAVKGGKQPGQSTSTSSSSSSSSAGSLTSSTSSSSSSSSSSSMSRGGDRDDSNAITDQRTRGALTHQDQHQYGVDNGNDDDDEDNVDDNGIDQQVMSQLDRLGM